MMKTLLRSAFLHRFAGGFVLGAVLLTAFQPAQAAVLCGVLG